MFCLPLMRDFPEENGHTILWYKTVFFDWVLPFTILPCHKYTYPGNKKRITLTNSEISTIKIWNCIFNVKKI